MVGRWYASDERARSSNDLMLLAGRSSYSGFVLNSGKDNKVDLAHKAGRSCREEQHCG